MTELHDKGDDKEFDVKVNGIQFESKTRFLSAAAILEQAAKLGAIPGKPDEYYLQGDKGKYSGKEEVDLSEDSVFITIPNTPTPVAT